MKAHLERVLVVDDDAEVRRVLERLLSRERYEVMTAEDGAEALRMAHAHHPALIILDVAMPRMDGCRVCERLQDHPVTSGIPVLMLSGLTQTEDVIRGLDGGADVYVNKPFNAKEPLARVRGLIARSRTFVYTTRRRVS